MAEPTKSDLGFFEKGRIISPLSAGADDRILPMGNISYPAMLPGLGRHTKWFIHVYGDDDYDPLGGLDDLPDIGVIPIGTGSGGHGTGGNPTSGSGSTGGGNVHDSDVLKALEDALKEGKEILDVAGPLITADIARLAGTLKEGYLRRWKHFLDIYNYAVWALTFGNATDKAKALADLAAEITDDLIPLFFEAFLAANAWDTGGLSLLGIALIEIIWAKKSEFGVPSTTAMLLRLLGKAMSLGRSIYNEFVKRMSIVTGFPEWLLRQLTGGFQFP